eukprot:COSAG06_NODE_2125_length_7539_cov_1.564651_4_plen_74_part_00
MFQHSETNLNIVLAEQESSKGVYMYNMHGMLLQLAEIHLRHAEWEQAAQHCSDAALLNPLDDAQYLTLAKAHR